jgi:hypothetical protein
MSRRLAAGVRELNAEFRARERDGARRVKNPRQRVFAGVGIKAETAMRDAALARDAGRLEDHGSRAGHGVVHHQLQVPVRRAAVVRGILTHRRDGDAVGNLYGTDVERRKQNGRHNGQSLPLGFLVG